MGATNRTTNYNLPQFVATDVPTWLTDVNGAMATIDTSIKGVADSVTTARAETDAVDTRVDATNTAVSDVAQRVTTAEQNISTLQQGLGVANSNISANAEKIGSATLQTTAQTLSGAVNELLSGETPVDLSSNFSSTYINFNHADHSVIVDKIGKIAIVELNLNASANLPNNAVFANGLPIPASHNVEVLAWTTAGTALVIPMQITRSTGGLYNRNASVPSGTTFRLTATYLTE